MKQGFQMTRVNKLEQVRFAMLRGGTTDGGDSGPDRLVHAARVSRSIRHPNCLAGKHSAAAASSHAFSHSLGRGRVIRDEAAGRPAAHAKHPATSGAQTPKTPVATTTAVSSG